MRVARPVRGPRINGRGKKDVRTGRPQTLSRQREGRNARGARDPRSLAQTRTSRRTKIPDILHRVGINAPVGKVYDVLTTVEGARAWWDASATGDAKEGGLLTFFKKVDMKVIEAKPNEIVRP